MVKEAQRKCSHCGQQGHNSRTCNNRNNVISPRNRNWNGNGNGHSFKLFGVNIVEGAEDSMKKSRSMGNLAALSGGQGKNDVVEGGEDNDDHVDHDDHDPEAGYLSDGVLHNVKRKAARERKRGNPWTEEEHRTFLAGINKLGKGDWRGISSKFVTTRTPTQVASHAQKYFIRQQAPKDRKKRRSSLFDMPFTQSDDVVPPQCHQVSSMIKPTAETSSRPSRSQGLAENNPSEILNRFPHLCLDNYPVPVRPGVAPNYLVPYGVGFPGNVQPWPLINMGRPSYLYNVPNVYGSVDNGVPVVVTHPSGIPPPRSPPTSPSIKAAASKDLSADQTNGLELTIGQPQSKQGSELSSSPASGAIKVT